LFQASRLHRKGVTISVYDIDGTGEAPVEDEENQDTVDDEIDADDDIETDEDEDLLDKSHWTDSSYPDPDIELGLKNSTQTGNGQSVGNENSDKNG